MIGFRVMALERFSLSAPSEWAGLRLDHALSEWLPKKLGEPVSRARVRALIVGGGVYLNRKRVRIASKTLIAGAHIEVILDRVKLRSPVAASAENISFGEANVIFEDEFLLAVNKPAGMPTQPTLDSARLNLFDAVKKLRPQSYIGLHHRLDRDTSGVVLFTKKKEMNSPISDLFKDHGIQKTYRALIEVKSGAQLLKNWSVQNFLKVTKDRGKKNRVVSVRSGGDSALTDFQLLERMGSFAVVRALPRTGRMHQIRVHLSEAKMPILGDVFYGGLQKFGPNERATEFSRVMLHAELLEFEHPATQQKIKIEAQIPEDFKKCQQSISRLG